MEESQLQQGIRYWLMKQHTILINLVTPIDFKEF